MDNAIKTLNQDDNDDILGMYKSFDDAGVNIWDYVVDGVNSPDRTDIRQSTMPCKEKSYIYASHYNPFPYFSNSKLSETSRIVNEGESCTISEPVYDEIMEESNLSDDSSCIETRHNLSNNSLPSTSSDMLKIDVQTSKICDFDVSNTFGDDSTGHQYSEESNTNVSTHDSRRMNNKIMIMIVDKTKKRNSTINKPNIDEPKREKMEKKPKAPEDHLKLKKMRHVFTRECDICGFTPSFISTCKFHNDETFLFHRRKTLALSDNSDIIPKIDQLLPKSYQLISCDYSDNGTGIVPNLSTQWFFEKKKDDEKKIYLDNRAVHRFFRDFAAI